MDLLFNELSIHGQFPDLSTFRAAVDRVMTMRRLTTRFGRELYCHRNVANGRVTSEMTMPQAVQALDPNSRRALMSWLQRQGPFWEDARLHSGDDYLECIRYDGEIVTDTAVGEAAYCCLHGRDRGLVSMDPSDWLFPLVPVDWHADDDVRRVDVRNYWDADRLAAELDGAPPPLGSWTDLEAAARNRCPDLIFAPDGFKPQLRIHFSWPIRADEPLCVVYVGPKITKR